MPTAAFDVTKSVYAGRSVISFTPTGGAAKVFESIKVDYKDDSEYAYVYRPDSLGVQRPVRKVKTKGGEHFTYMVDEAKRLLSDLFSSSLSGIVQGTAIIYEPDPTDTGGNVALKSESFACALVLNNGLGFGDGKVTTAEIDIQSLKASGSVTWTADGGS